MRGNMVLNQDFKEFIESLNDNNVRYLIIGGYAVAFHGHPRYTKDLDVWVWISQDNAANMVKALDQFGFASLGLEAEDFLEPKAKKTCKSTPKRSSRVYTRAFLFCERVFLTCQIRLIAEFKARRNSFDAETVEALMNWCREERYFCEP
ncbi:MAG: hypothetical protein ACPGWR_09650 [Ardenticatenaceae bacterium]